MRALITGAAGFLGSHLAERFLAEGYEVVGVDNFITGTREQIARLDRDSCFQFMEHDVSTPFSVEGKLDGVLHFASPASPVDYLEHPVETLQAGAAGTHNTLELARAHGARYLLASTSEVYGDPAVHPQPESYWGNVNPVGPRSVYDEAKRYAEALTNAYRQSYSVNTGIARIFNTYGPRMRADGRVVANFIVQALRGEPLTVYGDGSQTRSFCYVDDEIDGLFQLFCHDCGGPINIGHPEEFSVAELARIVTELVGNRTPPVFLPLPEDDPLVRCPDIDLARQTLGWKPKVSLNEGLTQTVAYFRTVLAKEDVRPRTLEGADGSNG